MGVRTRLLGFLLCLAVWLMALADTAAAQCPPQTSVVDTIFNADGSLASGRVVIAWPTFQIGSCQVVAGQVTVNVNSGALTVQLYPNDAATPAGTSYRVTYYLKSGRVSTEYWVVPTSATPVALALVRSPSVPVPAVMFGQAQVTNLVPDLARKVELPAPCPAGKFLQANGAASPPQVNCVDGTGAPLASSTQSGTVKTDVNEADPHVYTQASVDTLLAGKAPSSHAHAAADTTSGVFAPARLPLPTGTTIGAITSGSCSGTDKVNGISTSGAIICSPDQAGGSSSQHQVNAANLAANDPINLQDTVTIAFSNPSAGNVQAALKDSSVTATKLAAANPSSAQLSGIDDENIATAALSPNRIAGTAEVQTNKGAASGYASLNASSLVEQNPANAQVAPAASKIPLADATGKLEDGWLSSNVSLLGSSISLTSEVAGTLPLANGGTGQAAWTAARCVRVNNAGTALESAAADCGSGGSGDSVSVNGSAATDADFDDTTPAAPAGAINVKWQKDTSSPNNVSAHVPFAAPLGVSGSNLTLTGVVAAANGGTGINSSGSTGVPVVSGGTWTIESAKVLRVTDVVRPLESKTNSVTTDQDYAPVATVPANYFDAGKIVRVTFLFEYSTAGGTTTHKYYVKLGSSKVWENVAQDPPNNITRNATLVLTCWGTGTPAASVPVECSIGAPGNWPAAPNNFNTIAQPVNLATNGSLNVVPGVVFGGTGSNETIVLRTAATERF